MCGFNRREGREGALVSSQFFSSPAVAANKLVTSVLMGLFLPTSQTASHPKDEGGRSVSTLEMPPSAFLSQQPSLLRPTLLMANFVQGNRQKALVTVRMLH